MEHRAQIESTKLHRRFGRDPVKSLQDYMVRDMLGRMAFVVFATIVLLIHALVAPSTAVEAPASIPYSIVYRSPDPDAPVQRVGSVVRGGPGVQLSLQVLAPESVGVTNSAQPTLYWFSSGELPYPIELVITDDHHIEPLLEVRLRDGFPAGIHRIALADYKFHLQRDVTYRWSIAAIVDPANRSRDLVASGAIRRVEPEPRLAEILKSSPTTADPAVYAENGVWYEALSSLDRMIRTEPNNRVWRLLRASLLDQVNLDRVAAIDRQGP